MTEDLAQPDRRAPLERATSSPPRWAWARGFVLRCLVGALVVVALVAALSALVGELGPLAVRVFATVAMLVVVSLLILYDAEVSARRSDAFAVAGLVVSGLLVFLGLVEIWVPRPSSDGHGLGTWLLLVVIARVALLHVHLLLTVYRRFPTAGMRWLSRLTVALVGLLAALLSVAVVVDGVLSAGYWRAVAAVAILDATGTVLVPLTHTLFHREKATAPPPGSTPYVVPVPQQREQVPVQPEPQAHPGAVPGWPGGPPSVPVLLPDPARFRYAPPAPGPRRLAWPRYEDGRPLPVRPDGAPDFTGVALR